MSVEVAPWRGRPWETVRRIHAAGVVALTPDHEVLLVRQFRPAIGQELTEIPAGLLDREGEDALTCAARELFEETGYRHASIEFLGGYYSSAGFTDEYVHLFFARTEPEQEGEPEDGIDLLREPFAAMVRAAQAGRVRDAKTALALLIAWARESGA